MKNLLLFFALFFTSAAFGQNVVQWEAVSMDNNNNTAKIVCQTSEGYIFAFLPIKKKLLISKDNTLTWQDVKVEGILNFSINRGSFSGDESGVLYIHINSIIYKFEANANEFKKYFTSYPYDIDVVKFGNDNIYILGGKNFSVYSKSTLTKLSSIPLPAAAIYFTLGKKKNFFVVEYQNWHTFNNDGSDFSDYDFEEKKNYDHPFSVLTSGKFVTLFYNELYFSDNEGTKWTKITSLPFEDELYGLFVNSQNELFVRRRNSLYFSKDEGITWTEIKMPNNNVFIDNIFNSKLGEIIITTKCETDNVFYLSKDKGKTWQKKSLKIDNATIKELKVDYQGDVISQTECFYYNNILIKNTTKWQNISLSDTSSIDNLMVLPSGKWLANNIYLNDSRYYTSSDKGITWQLYDVAPWNKNSSYKISKLSSGELISFDIDKYYTSPNEGVTWEAFPALNIKFPYPYNYDNNSLIKTNGYLVSSDVEWELEVYDLVAQKQKTIAKIDSNLIYDISKLYKTKSNQLCFIAMVNDSQGFNFKLFFSSDCTTFTSKKVSCIGFKADFSDFNFKEFYIDKNNNFIVLTDDNIYISYDEGDTWLPMKGNLPSSIEFSSMTISPDDYLYLVTKGGLIYKNAQKTTKTQEITQENINFNIFPNPTNESVELSISEQKEVFSSVHLYSIEGKLLNTERFEGKNTTLDVHALPSGMYFLQVKNGVQTGVQKLIVQH